MCTGHHFNSHPIVCFFFVSFFIKKFSPHQKKCKQIRTFSNFRFTVWYIHHQAQFIDWRMAMVFDQQHRTASNGCGAFNSTANCEIGYSSWQTRERGKKEEEWERTIPDGWAINCFIYLGQSKPPESIALILKNQNIWMFLNTASAFIDGRQIIKGRRHYQKLVSNWYEWLIQGRVSIKREIECKKNCGRNVNKEESDTQKSISNRTTELMKTQGEKSSSLTNRIVMPSGVSFELQRKKSKTEKSSSKFQTKNAWIREKKEKWNRAKKQIAPSSTTKICHYDKWILSL